MVLNGLVRFLVAIYCTQILFQIFRNPIRPCHAPGNSCLISRSNSHRLENFGIKKGGTCRATRNDWKPQSSRRFKSVRSIQIGPFWYKKELSGKSYLLNSLATLLALLEGVYREFPFGKHEKRKHFCGARIRVAPQRVCIAPRCTVAPTNEGCNSIAPQRGAASAMRCLEAVLLLACIAGVSAQIDPQIYAKIFGLAPSVGSDASQMHTPLQ